MVGMFSRFSVAKNGHRRTQSALEEREVLPASSDLVASSNISTTATELKPVENLIEPLDNDKPIQCPLPEPSILNDRVMWKERVSASMRRRRDLEIVQDEMVEESEGSMSKPSQSSQCNQNRWILPSVSAPEQNLLNLLEECNETGSS